MCLRIRYKRRSSGPSKVSRKTRRASGGIYKSAGASSTGSPRTNANGGTDNSIVTFVFRKTAFNRPSLLWSTRAGQSSESGWRLNQSGGLSAKTGRRASRRRYAGSSSPEHSGLSLAEAELAIGNRDPDHVLRSKMALKYLFSQRIFDRRLDRALQGPGTEHRVETD